MADIVKKESTESGLISPEKPSFNVPISEEEATPNNMQAIAGDMLKRDAVNFDWAAQTWSPEEIGETKRLMFLGIEIAEIPDIETGELKNVPFVMFIEAYLDKSNKPAAKQCRVSGSLMVSHFGVVSKDKAAITGYRWPVKSLWEVQFTGTRKSKNDANRKLNVFSFKSLDISKK